MNCLRSISKTRNVTNKQNAIWLLKIKYRYINISYKTVITRSNHISFCAARTYVVGKLCNLLITFYLNFYTIGWFKDEI